MDENTPTMQAAEAAQVEAANAETTAILADNVEAAKAVEPTLQQQFPKLVEAGKKHDEMKAIMLSRYDAETVELLNAQANAVDEAERVYEDLKKQANEAKKEMEGEELKLRALIRERKENRGKPRQATLLDLVPNDADDTPPAQVVAEAAADPLENLWQEYPLERMTRFGMTESDIEKLRVGRRKRGLSPVPLHTVGDMARYTAGDPNNPGFPHELTDFDGIGPSVSTRIEDAAVGFHAWWGNGGGRAEYAAERGLTSGQAEGHPVEPGPAAEPRGSGGDPGPGDGDGGEPVGDPGGDAGGPAVAYTDPADQTFQPPEGQEEFSLGDQEGE